MVSVDGNAPVMAIIEYASQSECRMRSMNVFNVGDRLEFPLSIHGTPTIALSGTVVNRRQIGPRYAYVLALLPAPTQAEAIVKATQTAPGRTRPILPTCIPGTGSRAQAFAFPSTPKCAIRIRVRRRASLGRRTFRPAAC